MDQPSVPDNAQAELRELEDERLQAKADEDAAKKRRIDIEQQILTHPALPTLTDTGTNDLGFTKIVTGETETWDQLALAEYHKTHKPDPGHWPFKTAFKPDPTRLDYLRENYPEYMKTLEDLALSVKPKKPSFKEVPAA